MNIYEMGMSGFEKKRSCLVLGKKRIISGFQRKKLKWKRSGHVRKQKKKESRVCI